MMILCIFVLVFAGLAFLQKKSFFGLIFGFVLLSNGINLSIFFGSKPTAGGFAFINGNLPPPESNDPLPQALVLTAIVIGFALLAFVVALIKKSGAAFASLDSDDFKAEESLE